MKGMSGGREAPALCPVCGDDVPPGAAACPGCGADDETGWNEEATASDGLSLPGGDFDYDDFVRREFGGKQPPAPRRLLASTVAGLAALALLLWWLGLL